jgi:hypothetical protein
MRTVAWTLLWIAAALLAAGVGTGAGALSTTAQYRELCRTHQAWTCDKDDKEGAALGLALVAAGVILAGFATLLLAIRPPTRGGG